MRKLIILLILISLLSSTVNATEFTAPQAPESAQKYMPYQQKTFWEDLWWIVQNAIKDLMPSFSETVRLCVSLIGLALLISLLSNFKGVSLQTVELAGALLTAVLLLEPSKALVRLGVDTVKEISEYGKLLIPVMASALAAEGGVTTAAALYAGTILFNTVLSTAVTKLISPLVFIFLAVMIGNAALTSSTLESIGKMVKWLITWILKVIIFLFTGYISITGVISGTTDAAALKAAKLTLSGVVPVVGGMISDASEAVLVSASVMKNAAGIYGLLAIAAIFMSPFIAIGVQYLLLKATAGVCKAFGVKPVSIVTECFTSAMGFLLAMTGVVTLLFLFSTTCYMKGIA